MSIKRMMTSTDCSNNKSASFWEITMYLPFLKKETDFFDEINAALRNDILKIRSRLTDYLLSVLLNSIMANYISTISSIDDALEDLEEELLMITNENDIGIQIQGLRRQYMLMKKGHPPA